MFMLLNLHKHISPRFYNTYYVIMAYVLSPYGVSGASAHTAVQILMQAQQTL